MVVRIPATLVAIAYGLALDAATLLMAQRLGLELAPIALLPLWALLAGIIAGRWARPPAPLPGLAVGLHLGAVQIGLAFGAVPSLRPLADTSLVMIQVMSAMSGGLIGTILARRASQQPEIEYSPLS
jgi:mannose/fructose/N-acetylgalactosamine-specific phosphotransferase system component IIC